MMPTTKLQFHFFSILIIGVSATFWAVNEDTFFLPLLWLIVLSVWILATSPAEYKMFFRRFSKIGSLLLSVSLIQIIFRRHGGVIFAVHGFPLIFSEGLREAVLLWIRFMIIFMLAFIFAQVSLFNFLLFLNKIKISYQLSLLLLTTIKFIPFIFEQAKRGLWAIRFRGIQIGELRLNDKFRLLRKIFTILLFRGVHYASFSSLALELRGYGVDYPIRIPQKYSLKLQDFIVLAGVIVINLLGIFFI